MGSSFASRYWLKLSTFTSLQHQGPEKFIIFDYNFFFFKVSFCLVSHKIGALTAFVSNSKR